MATKHERVNLDLPLPVKEEVMRLSEVFECSMCETMRRCIRITGRLTRFVRSGGRVILRAKDGTEETVIFL